MPKFCWLFTKSEWELKKTTTPLGFNSELYFVIETGAKKIRLAQKFAITKKSIISCQFLLKVVTITSSWVGRVAWISVWLDKHCGFLLMAKFWVSIFLYFFCMSLLVECVFWNSELKGTHLFVQSPFSISMSRSTLTHRTVNFFKAVK